MLDSLPNKLWAYLFEFLDQTSYFGIATSCRKFAQIFKEHNKFWVRECLAQHFSFDLELYSEIYQCEDYKVYIKNKILSLTKKLWRQHFIEGKILKSQFMAQLKQIASKEQGEDFVNYIFQTLKEPNLPMINLKRETMVQSTRTIFQNHLSEVLYQDASLSSKKFNLADENKALIDSLNNYECQLLQEVMNGDKTKFLQARWYHFEKYDKLLDETTPIEQESDVALDSFNLPNLKLLAKMNKIEEEEEFPIKQNHSYLLNLYDCLKNTLIHFCRLVSEFLDSIENVYDLLAEYISRWKTYVCSMLELEKTCETFTNLFNKAYETAFEGYPSFPKFSIWRLMTKIWMKEVYEKAGFSKTLTTAFLQVLSNLREKNIKSSLEENKMNIEFPELKTDRLPKCLFINLQTKDKEIPSLSYCNLTENTHIYFEDCSQTEKELLSDFMQAILDISLTEVSIHYLDCSELPVNCPYKELEDKFLSECNDYYLSYQPLFCECPEYFCNFLKSDCFLLSGILLERTKYKFASLQFEHGLNFVKETLQNQLQDIHVNLDIIYEIKNKDDIHEFKNEEKEDVTNFAKELVKQILQDIKKQTNPLQADNFDCYDLPTLPSLSKGSNMLSLCTNLEEESQEDWANDKNFIDQVLLFISRKYKTMNEDFEYLNGKSKSLEGIREFDQFVKETNTNKNIPFEMGDVDCLFYDLDKEIGLPLLEKLYEDYVLFAQEQGKEINEPEETLQINNGGGHNMELEFGEDLGDDDLDLLNLGNLQLRRQLF